MNRYWMTSAIVLAAALGAGCGSRTVAAAPPEPTPVHVVAVEEVNFSDESIYTATLEPVAQLDLAFRAPGQVESLYLTAGRPLEAGDMIPAGSVLARLRRSEYEAKTASAEAQLADARAARASGAAQIREAEAASTLADQDLKRAEKLYEGQALTRAELDAVRARAHSAHSRVAATKATVDGLDARVRASHAALDETRVTLSDTVITAPFPAVVVARRIERGSTAGAGAVAYTLADLRQVKVRFGVPDTALQGLRAGSTVRMNVDALPDQRYQGRVIGVAPLADPATRLFTVEALVANPGGRLKAGMVASISMGATVEKRLPAVPVRAIRRAEGSDRFAVFTVDHDVLQLREVTVGSTEGSLIAVLTGLRAGERVVEDAGAGSKAGDKIRVIPPTTSR